MAELQAEIVRLSQTVETLNQRIADSQAAWKKVNKSSVPEELWGEHLDALAKAINVRKRLKQEIEDDALTIQAIKDEIADLLNRLGNCGAKTSTPTPSPSPKTPPSPAPPVQLPPFQGVPGEGEDCSELRRSFNYQKQILSNPNLSPESRQQFEKALENSRSKYCKCLTEKHLSPPPEICNSPKSTATPAPTPAPTPTQNTGNQVGYHVGTNTANGLVVTTFDTPQGKIKVNLPDDMAAGDTISGTVETEPAGKDEAERAKNQGELNGEVIDIGGQKTKVGDKKISWVIPGTLTDEAKTIVLQHNGQPLATTQIPISNTPPPTADSVHFTDWRPARQTNSDPRPL